MAYSAPGRVVKKHCLTALPSFGSEPIMFIRSSCGVATGDRELTRVLLVLVGALSGGGVANAMPIPLGVLPDRGPGRDGVNAPMDEDAEFGVEVPGRRGWFVQRGSVRFVLRIGGAKRGGKGEKKNDGCGPGGSNRTHGSPLVEELSRYRSANLAVADKLADEPARPQQDVVLRVFASSHFYAALPLTCSWSWQPIRSPSLSFSLASFGVMAVRKSASGLAQIRICSKSDGRPTRVPVAQPG